MSKIKRRDVCATILMAVLTAFVCWAFLLPEGTWFRLYDRERKETVLAVPVNPGDRFSLEIEHSFEHIPWFEYYTVTDDLQFNLDAIAVAGYGAGIPAEMDVATHIDENGMVWMEGINSVFPEFRWITSATYMKVFTLNGEEIFDFRDLPDASKILGEIVTKRGYLSRV